MNRNREMPTGLQVIPSFQIFLHIKDRALLERIQRSLGGSIYKHGEYSDYSLICGLS